jgi:intergrase/recombinase
LPKTVRLPRQRSTRLIYQGTTNEIVGSHRSITDEEYWNKYQMNLSKIYNKYTCKARLLYSKKYYYVLEESNAEDLLTLSNDNRIHAMKALATFSKYLGCYDLWKDIVQRYQLKWSTEDAVQTFQNMSNVQEDLNSMIKWIKEIHSKLPKSYGNILIYDTLTGLRPQEACESIRLLKNDCYNYLTRRENSMTLEHFKYPQFIRRTKKAYVSIINDQILETAKSCGEHSYNAVRLYIKKKGFDMHMAFCRKIFATHLRNQGVEPEIIDLLQGRSPKSVFARHYFKPDFNHIKIKESINSLYDSLAVIV